MTKDGNNTAIKYHRSFVAPGPALRQGPVPDPDNRDLLPLGPETYRRAHVESLEAEGQRGNYYYNLCLASPDYPDHSCAFMRA